MEANKKNRVIALVTSLGVHVVLVLLFLFLISWKAPNPPLSALGGIELNFGLDDAGSGDTQPDKPVGATDPLVDQPQDAPIESQQTPAEVEKPSQTLTSSLEETPVEIKENIPQKKETKEPTLEKPVEKKAADLKNSTETPAVKPGEIATKKGEAGNQGDDKGKVGDKGSPQGTLDAKALYGNPGTGGQGGAGAGGGFALQMAGWTWDEQPKAPKLPDNENGRIVFEIEVDETGEITSIKTLERSLSPEAERICKQEVLRRSLIKTSQGATPERSKGRVAFVLRTQ